MPFDCQFRSTHGQDVCVDSCPTTGTAPTFVFARVERPADLPPVEPHTIDVAVLDMHHGWPNLGHDAIGYGIQNIVCDVTPALRAAGLRVRVLSYDVRRGHQIPEAPGDRHGIYVGTGGPGHLDPRLNDGVSAGSQGIKEDPAWEPKAFALFDAIRADRQAALLAVCHTFGVMCRWLGIADVVLRGEEKGGKSSGIADNLLTDAAPRASVVQRPGTRAAGPPPAEDPGQPAVRPHPDGTAAAAGCRRCRVKRRASAALPATR